MTPILDPQVRLWQGNGGGGDLSRDALRHEEDQEGEGDGDHRLRPRDGVRQGEAEGDT